MQPEQRLMVLASVGIRSEIHETKYLPAGFLKTGREVFYFFSFPISAISIFEVRLIFKGSVVYPADIIFNSIYQIRFII
jgi:hypothetical protein